MIWFLSFTIVGLGIVVLFLAIKKAEHIIKWASRSGHIFKWPFLKLAL